MEYKHQGQSLFTCQHKQGIGYTCRFNRADGPIVCNLALPKEDSGQRGCNLYWRMCSLHDVMPELWTDDVCCYEWRSLMLNCVEVDGFAVGAVDIEIVPNDGKMVWRNFDRVIFKFCPFCGQSPRPNPFKVNTIRPRQQPLPTGEKLILSFPIHATCAKHRESYEVGAWDITHPYPRMKAEGCPKCRAERKADEDREFGIT